MDQPSIEQRYTQLRALTSDPTATALLVLAEVIQAKSAMDQDSAARLGSEIKLALDHMFHVKVEGEIHSASNEV
ncbi:MAG TPA: hypothetical protein VMG59_00305 [Phycisphaerae bacterium]|nr:hypothetical protein [Phycisphaerae bacterium]